MRNDRKTHKLRQGWEEEQQQQTEAAQFYSVKATRALEKNEGGVVKGKLIRNQLARSNKDAYCDKIKHERTLTPQYCKAQQIRKKQADMEDIQSFKLEQSNLNSQYLTIKKDLKEKGTEQTKKGINQEFIQQGMSLNKKVQLAKDVGNGTIVLSDGWIYKGQYTSGLFHGFGQLLYHNKIIYKGKFEYGYFHGYGQLHHCQLFHFLISRESIETRLAKYDKKHKFDFEVQQMQKGNWVAYFGEFRQGEVDGYGQLWLNKCKIVGCWEKGKIIKKSILLPNNKHF